MTRAVELAQIASAGVSEAFKNRIINGDMRIDQRNNGAAVTGQQYLVDRWRTWFDPGTYSFQRVTDAPAGFTSSLRITKTNTTQSNYAILLQHIEGNNIADLGWGTASARPVNLSFWVKSSITGTFSVSLNNADTTTRSYIVAYTINAANTWEFKTAAIPGPTDGTWNTDNTTGIQVKFNYGGGGGGTAAPGSWVTGDHGGGTGAMANLGTTNGATFQVTGVQLEVGSAATSFEYRPHTTELQLCQRYFEILAPAAIMMPWSSAAQITRISGYFQVTKRAPPTIDMRTKGGGTGTMGAAGSSISGVTYFGAGNQNDVIEYPSPTASIEL